MTAGGYLAEVVLGATALLHEALANVVTVSEGSGDEGGGHLGFELLPAGIELAQWMGDVIRIYVGWVGAVAGIPGLGADLAKLFTVLLS